MRLLKRGRPSEAAVTAAVVRAIARQAGATGHDLAYNHLQYGGGALSGVVEVTDARAFRRVLRTTYAALVEVLGDDAERVVVYLTGHGPEGPVNPVDLGLPDRPTGRDLARMSTLERPGEEA